MQGFLHVLSKGGGRARLAACLLAWSVQGDSSNPVTYFTVMGTTCTVMVVVMPV